MGDGWCPKCIFLYRKAVPVLEGEFDFYACPQPSGEIYITISGDEETDKRIWPASSIDGRPDDGIIEVYREALEFYRAS